MTPSLLFLDQSISLDTELESVRRERRTGRRRGPLSAAPCCSRVAVLLWVTRVMTRADLD
jgi:hypothetical protein